MNCKTNYLNTNSPTPVPDPPGLALRLRHSSRIAHYQFCSPGLSICSLCSDPQQSVGTRFKRLPQINVLHPRYISSLDRKTFSSNGFVDYKELLRYFKPRGPVWQYPFEQIQDKDRSISSAVSLQPSQMTIQLQKGHVLGQTEFRGFGSKAGNASMWVNPGPFANAIIVRSQERLSCGALNGPVTKGPSGRLLIWLNGSKYKVNWARTPSSFLFTLKPLCGDNNWQSWLSDGKLLWVIL